MEFLNATRMDAACTMGMERDGRELLVVAIKGSFVLPRPGEGVRLHDAQVPLLVADTFTGEPGFSAPLHEMDFAPRKPACDVLLVGSAHAEGGRPTTHRRVSLRVGALHKACEVVGDRAWEAGLTGIRASAPRPFLRLPLSYDLAFGGVDHESDYASEHDAFLPNPVGRGWRKHLKNAWVDGRPLPNTEEVGRPVSWPADVYAPMAFGPLGRGWSTRARWAGTYDQRWLDERFPFLPEDFDGRYHQAAPEDQQVPHPAGPLEVELTGFTPDGPRRFVLPHFHAPVHVFPRGGGREDFAAVLDTIVLEPDEERFTLTWRVTRPLRRNMLEIAQVLVGRKGREWWQDREEIEVPDRALQPAPLPPEEVVP
ncbi:DUF2169 domain-containing protein [Ramlibacter monticola]|uniref:DUF2169 domain-containing protein n=1 Tax=Ramlibacter monticola TaxID=1926872 RepID=A0A936Z1Y6_9BURK|nr:DUF2169 domain-containing protein [Ramlibacter monticola]MBL0392826.1 DUF2169 domain-containing protein [Ramlibacter monticola]